MTSQLPDYSSPLAALVPFSRIRLVVLDVDGTLLQPEADSFLSPVKKLCSSLQRTHGVSVTIATGRALAGVLTLLSDLDIAQRTPFVVYNGSVVCDRLKRDAKFFERVIHRSSLPKSSFSKIKSIAEQSRVTLLAYYVGIPFEPSLISEDVRETVYGWSNAPPYSDEFNHIRVAWNRAIPEQEPVAALIDLADQRCSDDLVVALRSIPGTSVTASGGRFIEIRPAKADKASALSLAAKTMGVDRSQVLAVGDADNDAEMLRWAGISVVIRNGSSRAVEASDYETRYGAARGAVEVLRLVKQAHRYHKEGEP